MIEWKPKIGNMKNCLRYFFSMLPVFFTISAFGQQAGSIVLVQSDTADLKTKTSQEISSTLPLPAAIIPSAAMAYGFVKLGNNALTSLDLEARHEFYSEHPHRKFIIDDYLQFAPGAAAFALNGLGVSSWYTISAYSGAVAVGLLRMYNNKHWFSDVVAGAGLGVLSTQVSYWLYPKIKKLLSGQTKNNAFILPSYNHGAIGAGMVKTF